MDVEPSETAPTASDTVREPVPLTWPLSPTMQCHKTIKKRTGGITSLAISSNLDIIYAASYDGSVTLVPVETQQETTDGCFGFRAHKNTIWSLSYSERTRRLYSGSSDAQITVWNAAYLESVMGETHQRTASTSTSNSGSRNQAQSIQDPVGEVRTLGAHQGKIYSLLNAGSALFSAASDRTVRMWNEDTLDCMHVFQGHTDNVNTLAYDFQQNRLFSGSSDKSIRIWDIETRECVQRLSSETSEVLDVVLGCSLASDGGEARNLVFASRYDASIEVWDVRAMNSGPVATMVGHNWEVWKLAYANKSGHGALFSGSFDRTLLTLCYEDANNVA